ncbi:MAG: hypothetical protein ACM3SY_17850 [Candidatus Omnitrophota bacterium]
MKQKKEQKLTLGKVTVQNLEPLNQSEQQEVKGGMSLMTGGIPSKPDNC